MTRENKLKKYSRKLCSGQCDIAQFTIQYLEETVKLLNRKLKQNDITKREYNSRIIEIEKLQTEINDLRSLVKELKDEVNTLKEENRKLRQENSKLHDTLSVLCNNFGLIQITDENENSKQIQVKNQEVINLNGRIRKILEEYRQKYERDSNTVEAGPSKITKLSRWRLFRKELEEKFFNDLEENDPIKNLVMAIHSVDCYQLVGYYMHPSIHHSKLSTHLLFFLRKDIDTALSEYNMLPKSLQSEWIEKKLNSVQEYQTEILKMKHPSITNENIQNVLENATFYFPENYNLQDNLVNIEN
ncbi:9132_t:CDS:2 [Cetraspora pellucida]|uniref:9132_t:CDS:1 n=1 Tax=Cetraspora pellucida TaxID=1433469 RepID=A0ACA9N7I3_9GLOM|nr:9132_t:CDS:2 [Cetraspora pellucida]